MPLKKEPCRNFQRGSCRFGDHCKFLHITQQQPKPNAFGFGSQTATPFQQQKPNPFGFGVQNRGPNRGAQSSGGLGQPNSQKPFENKWIRSEQPQNQSQAASHMCTDPDSCKRQIAEDFQHESPLWKLTCYGHYKYLPCDIIGDISYEELRAVAYDDAKRGTSFLAIVEKERSLVNSKKIEFDNLLNNPAIGASSPSLTPNLSFGVSPTPSNSGFGKFQGPGTFGSNSVSSGPFGPQVPAQMGGNLPATNTSGYFGNSGMNNQGPFSTQVPAQSGGNQFAANISGFSNGNNGMSLQGSQFPAQIGVNTFTPNEVGFDNMGMTGQGPQVRVQTGGAPFTSDVGGFGISSMNSQGNQLPSTSSVSLNAQTSAVSNSSMLFNGPGGANGNQKTIENNSQEISATDASIWSKQEWKLGEIPEQPPPAAYVR